MFKKIVSSLKSAVSYSFFKESFNFIFSTSKKVLTVPPGYEEGNKVAIENLNISKDEIKIAKNSFSLLMWVYLIFFIFIISYTIICIANQSIVTAIIGVASSMVCLALVFKYHFWLTQIKLGYLGITLEEWYGTLWK